MRIKRVKETDKFTRAFNKFPVFYRERIIKLIKKIIENPEIGKSMRYARKGTRELYIKPFRLSYAYHKTEDKITLLDLYHKKRQ